VVKFSGSGCRSGKGPAINTIGYPGILARVKSKNPSASTRNIDTSNHQIKCGTQSKCGTG
jgi:hypothetical protein